MSGEFSRINDFARLRNVVRKPSLQFLILVLVALLVTGRPVSRAADKPLSPDDVTLLLIGGASSQKVVDLIKQRGIGFKMTADLANGFRRDGADEPVIQALESASSQSSSQPPSASGTANPPPSPSKPSLKRPSESGSGSNPAPASPAAPVSAPGARIGADGHFDVVWTSDKPVRPEPYPTTRTREQWATFLAGLQQRWNGRWEAPAE